MSVLTKQFQDALTRLEPSDDATHAAEAHAEIREVLKADEQLLDWGLHTLLIGSYARDVSIRRVNDVDVFCQLPHIPQSMDPQDLLQVFTDVLTRTHGHRVSKNDRSVKVEFPQFDMHVDVVPARPHEGVWQIPDKQGGWEITDPLRFGGLTTQRNKDHAGNYVPIVKLLRQTRRALLHEAKPGGLFVEVTAYHAFADVPVGTAAPRSIAEFYTEALERMARILADHADGTAPIMNPAVPGQELHVRATADEFHDIATAWAGAAQDARAALDSDDAAEAGTIFAQLLGETSEGVPVFVAPKASSHARAVPGHRTLPSGGSPTFG